MTQRPVEAQTRNRTGQISPMFSDVLPQLTQKTRDRVNATLIAKLGRILGWSRYA